MRVTAHARKRMKERCGIGKKACGRMAGKAFRQGITHAQTRGKLNKWITGLYFCNPKANNIRLYGEAAYIFCGETLVTVIRIPQDIFKDMDKMIKDNRPDKKKG